MPNRALRSRREQAALIRERNERSSRRYPDIGREAQGPGSPGKGGAAGACTRKLSLESSGRLNSSGARSASEGAPRGSTLSTEAPRLCAATLHGVGVSAKASAAPEKPRSEVRKLSMSARRRCSWSCTYIGPGW